MPVLAIVPGGIVSGSISNALKYGLGFGLLGLVVYRNWRPGSGQPGLAEVFERPMSWGLPTASSEPATYLLPLLAALVIAAAAILLTFVRWHLLVRAQELPFALRDAFSLGMVGFYFNTFLPGSVGGDLLKAYFIAREQSRRTVAVATVLIDRAVGLWALVGLCALIGSVCWLAGNPVFEKPFLRSLVATTLGIVAATVALWVFLGVLPEWRAQRFAGRLSRLPRVGNSAAEFWWAIWMYRQKPRAVMTALAMSFVSHTGFVLTFFLASMALNVGRIPTLAEHFLIVPVGLTIQALIPTPGGVGAGEYGFGGLYLLIGFPMAAGVLGSLGLRLIFWTLGLIGYITYLRMKRTIPEPATEPALQTASA